IMLRRGGPTWSYIQFVTCDSCARAGKPFVSNHFGVVTQTLMFGSVNSDGHPGFVGSGDGAGVETEHKRPRLCTSTASLGWEALLEARRQPGGALPGGARRPFAGPRAPLEHAGGGGGGRPAAEPEGGPAPWGELGSAGSASQPLWGAAPSDQPANFVAELLLDEGSCQELSGQILEPSRGLRWPSTGPGQQEWRGHFRGSDLEEAFCLFRPPRAAFGPWDCAQRIRGEGLHRLDPGGPGTDFTASRTSDILLQSEP
ncbi:unnamed protein product, partial [Prorocentrum cordatum]